MNISKWIEGHWGLFFLVIGLCLMAELAVGISFLPPYLNKNIVPILTEHIMRYDRLVNDYDYAIEEHTGRIETLESLVINLTKDVNRIDKAVLIEN